MNFTVFFPSVLTSAPPHRACDTSSTKPLLHMKQLIFVWYECRCPCRNEVGSCDGSSGSVSSRPPCCLPEQEYIALLKTLFDFPRLSELLARPDFNFVFDGMHGVAGTYARRLFVDELGAPEASLLRCETLCAFLIRLKRPGLTFSSGLLPLGGCSRRLQMLADLGKVTRWGRLLAETQLSSSPSSTSMPRDFGQHRGAPAGRR